MATATGMGPDVRVLTAYNPGQATAGTDSEFALFRAPFAGTVTAVTYAPNAAITGAATNHRAIRLRNKGQTGGGSTVIAELAFDNGINAAAFDEKTIPLTTPASNQDVAEGDILAIFSDAIGTGMADPGGLICVTVSRASARPAGRR